MRLALLSILCLLLVGCGGSGGSGGGGNPDPNAFAGDWAGTWTTASQNGTAEVNIDDEGHIVGAVENLTTSQQGTITADITNDGEIEAHLSYNGGSPFSGEGTFVLSQDGNTITGSIGNGAGEATYTLNRVP
jgi:hypothetical protein